MAEVDVAENLKRVQDRVAEAALRAGRNPDEVIIIGASKLVDPDRMIQAYQAGLRHFGENYIQEALKKIPVVDDGVTDKVTWHYIGNLQRSNIPHIAASFDYIQTVSGLRNATILNRRIESELLGEIPILIEVNLAGEATKSGISPENLEELASQVSRLPSLLLRGLMAMPPIFHKPEASRRYFVQLRELRDRLQPQIPNLQELFMGTTADYQVAVEEGATMVRIGMAIFGERR